MSLVVWVPAKRTLVFSSLFLVCVFSSSKCWLCHRPGQSCRIEECQESSPCVDSVAIGSCDCCTVCSRKHNETCGGHNYSLGKCEGDLECVLPFDEREYNFTGHEAGTCQNATSYCPGFQIYHGCAAVENYCSCVSVPSCSKVNFPFKSYNECKRALAGDDLESVLHKNAETTCLFKEKNYSNGEEWLLDNCSRCVCQNGVTLCRHVQCNTVPENCGRMVIPEKECCPVCIGCVSHSGHWYNNSDTWKEDDCTMCDCLDGHVRCQAEMCQLNCPHPKKVPGRCCPVCEGNCDLICPNGYKKNATGHSMCECESTEKCPSMEKCKKECMHGFKVDKDGCERCKCIKCPETPDCDKKCSHGFLMDEQGCPLCKCRAVDNSAVGDAVSSSTSISGSPPATGFCLSHEGVQQVEGSIWYDGCHMCTCKNAHILCSMVTCPNVHCDKPLKHQGQCCPTCPDVPVLSHSNECEHKNVVYDNGETWRVSDCTQCVCIAGHKLCTEQTCQHTCQNAVKIRGQCCPVCAAGAGEQPSGFSSILTVLVIMCIILVVLLVAVGFLVMFVLKWHNGASLSLRHPCPWKTKGSMSLQCPKSTQLDYRASFYEYAEAGVKPVAL